MAAVSLTTTQDYTEFFRRRVLDNVQYWQDYVTKRISDLAALDCERDRIVKAISYALDLEEAWPTVYDLLIAFSPYMERRGYWVIWQSILKQAIIVAQQLEHGEGETDLALLRARLSQQQGHTREAISQYRGAVRRSRQAGDDLNRARAYTNLGWIYLNQSQWYRAEVLCRQLWLFLNQAATITGGRIPKITWVFCTPNNVVGIMRSAILNGLVRYGNVGGTITD